jgi:hypothetical protein
MYDDSSYGRSNATTPDTRLTKGNGDQKLGGGGGTLFYWQLTLLVLLVTVFIITSLLAI